jgi:Tfp pilus assembly protein PilP
MGLLPCEFFADLGRHILKDGLPFILSRSIGKVAKHDGLSAVAQHPGGVTVFKRGQYLGTTCCGTSYGVGDPSCI